MQPRPEERYLDLLKKTLSFALWPEPLVPVHPRFYGKPVKKFGFEWLAGYLRKRNMFIARRSDRSNKSVTDGQTRSGYGDTMIGLKRLDNLQDCIQTVLRDRVEGDLIECGVWRGGACIFMRGVLAAFGVEDRKVYVADSFEGLPKPDSEKYPEDAGDRLFADADLAVSREIVENNFRRYGLLDEQVVFLKGWFKDTLPKAPIDRLSILRLDGDMYGSTMETLLSLYPKLSRGGFCIVDDYALLGCRKAVDDYRREHGIHAAIQEIDWTGIYWRKE
jgi:O-methyltransferase